MRTRNQFKITRWLMLVALLALSLLLTGCMEDIIEAEKGEATPSIDSSESSIPPSDGGKLCVNCTVAEFNPNTRRVALPNDAILDALFAEGVVLSGNPDGSENGVAKNMPIRIPFDGPIDLTSALVGNIFMLDITGVPAAGPVLATDFNITYLDSNNDLVLVPKPGTFTNGSTYAVVITKGVLESDAATPIEESLLFWMLKSTTPLVDAYGHSLVGILDDETAARLEPGRLEMAPLIAGLEAAPYNIPRASMALIFTFTIEATDSTALLPSMWPTMEAGVTADKAATASVEWMTGSAWADAPGTPDDFTGLFSGSAPVDAIAAINMGRITCIPMLKLDADSEFSLLGGTPAQCPNTNAGSAPGYLDFWLSDPIAATAGIVVYMHPITKNKETFIAIANTLASVGLATLAFDMWGHGSRIYPDPTTGLDAGFLRPDNPFLSVGYMTQGRMDILRFGEMARSNPDFATVLGTIPANSNYLVAVSMGTLIGALTTSTASNPFDKVLFSNPGGDLIDILLEGAFGPEDIFPAVAALKGVSVGSPEFNSIMVGLEMSFRHAVFAGMVDSLAVYDPASTANPASVLVQEIIGDGTVPNNTTQLMAMMMGIDGANTFADGDGNQVTTRTRWIFDPANYSPTTAGHAFLLDGLTTATAGGQGQMVQYLMGPTVDDPSIP